MRVILDGQKIRKYGISLLASKKVGKILKKSQNNYEMHRYTRQNVKIESGIALPQRRYRYVPGRVSSPKCNREAERNIMRKRHTEPQNIIRVRKLATTRIHTLNQKISNELFRDPYLLTKDMIVQRAEAVSDMILQHYKETFLPDILTQTYMVSHNYGLQETHCPKSSPLYITNTKRIIVDNSFLSDLISGTVDKAKKVLAPFAGRVKDALMTLGKKLLPAGKKATPKDIAKVQRIVKDVVDQVAAKTQDAITETASEGKLDAYDKAKITSVQVQIETVRDKRRCKHCAQLDGITIPIEQARGLLPIHPNCRCLWFFKSLKGISKSLQTEQKQQADKVNTLRRRLQQRATHKTKSMVAVHNVAEQSYADAIDPAKALYAALHYESSHSPYYYVLYDVPVHQRKDKCCILNAADYCVEGQYHGRTAPMTIPTGCILNRVSHSKDTQYFEIVANVVSPDVRKEYRQSIGANSNAIAQMQTIPLVPDSIKEYPYVLGTANNVQLIMVNNKRGYLAFTDSNVRTSLMPFDALLHHAIQFKFIL
jgi:hypothetical protein